jgi:hypothetical protein
VQLPRRRLTTSSSLEKRTKVPLMLRSESWQRGADQVDAAVRARDARVVDLHVGRRAAPDHDGHLGRGEPAPHVAPDQTTPSGPDESHGGHADQRGGGVEPATREDVDFDRLDAPAQAHEIEAAEHGRAESSGRRAARRP